MKRRKGKQCSQRRTYTDPFVDLIHHEYKMQRLLIRIIVALLTFAIGIAATIWLSTERESSQTALPSAVDLPGVKKQTNDIPLPCSVFRSKTRISESEAVRSAECFVIGNGYTDLPPMEDKTKLSYESFDDGPPAEQALERRHDTLESRAYGVRNGGKVRDGWSVVFRYNVNNRNFSVLAPEFLEHLKTVGRCVTMDAYGANLRVQHQDAELSRFQRIPF